MNRKPTLRRSRLWLVLSLALLAVFAAPGVAHAGGLTPGAVFTQTNTVPNFVSVFQRNADGTLTSAGQVATGGDGRPAANPPLGLPTLDTGRDVELSSDGGNKQCLFVTNAGSDTVSSFNVSSGGITLADQKPTFGSRPISLTSTQRGPTDRVLYVLNSDTGSASIQGYYVSSACTLTLIPDSHRLMTTQASLPATVAFNLHGTALVVPERLAPGPGDFDVFPVDASGLVAATPVVSPSAGVNPYGIAWDSRDQLTVSNENLTGPGGPVFSTVTSYQMTKDYQLVPVNTVSSMGAACWNVITNDSRFLYISQPLGQLFMHSVNVYSVGNDGTLTPTGGGADTPFNAIDEALSHNSQYLYVLSDGLMPPAAASAISEFSIDPKTGDLTPIGVVNMAGNSTAGLAAW